MMKMDGLDSAKCKKSRRRDIIGIMGKFNERDKITNSDLLQIKRTKGEGDAVAGTVLQ